MENTHRYIAKIIVETESALAVGSGQSGLETDRLIASDCNDLPYIPGTSLAGVIRHAYEAMTDKFQTDALFGFQDLKANKGEGSRIIFSSAHLVTKDGDKIIDGLRDTDYSRDDFYRHFFTLPERDHVRMTEKGVADTKEHGKFDEQLVYKGTRFGFEVELIGTADDKTDWESLLNIFAQPYFRIGAGTRNGFGEISVDDIKARSYDLADKDDLSEYLNKTSSLNDDYIGFKSISLAKKDGSKWKPYSVTLKPEDFFLFGAGMGDLDADLRPKTEKVICWKDGRAAFSEEQILIPATSVKGAISHRLAFHYNRISPPEAANQSFERPDTSSVLNEITQLDFGVNLDELKNKASNDDAWAKAKAQIEGMNFGDFVKDSANWKAFTNKMDTLKTAEKENKRPVGEHNPAVRALFGYAKQDKKSPDEGQIGHVIISDVHKKKKSEKIFSHVAIDRFTAGGIDGALFQEKVATLDAFKLEIMVHDDAFPKEDPNVMDAWKATMEDLKKGWIPLGGSTTKGHGVFIAHKT